MIAAHQADTADVERVLAGVLFGFLIPLVASAQDCPLVVEQIAPSAVSIRNLVPGQGLIDTEHHDFDYEKVLQCILPSYQNADIVHFERTIPSANGLQGVHLSFISATEGISNQFFSFGQNYGSPRIQGVTLSNVLASGSTPDEAKTIAAHEIGHQFCCRHGMDSSGQPLTDVSGHTLLHQIAQDSCTIMEVGVEEDCSLWSSRSFGPIELYYAGLKAPSADSLLLGNQPVTTADLAGWFGPIWPPRQRDFKVLFVLVVMDDTDPTNLTTLTEDFRQLASEMPDWWRKITSDAATTINEKEPPLLILDKTDYQVDDSFSLSITRLAPFEKVLLCFSHVSTAIVPDPTERDCIPYQADGNGDLVRSGKMGAIHRGIWLESVVTDDGRISPPVYLRVE